MEAISHRGYWRNRSERNTLESFVRSFNAGYAAEIDVRDLAGDLVVSHDPPVHGELAFETVLDAYRQAGCPGTLAINIKADGLASHIKQAMTGIRAWFAFDMSVPDALQYSALALPHYSRRSEYEPVTPLTTRADGIWIDCFEREWASESVVTAALDAGQAVCLVSPELHGRDAQASWNEWRTWDARNHPEFRVCTDLPTQLMQAMQ